MPNRPAPSKTRLAIWIDRNLLTRYRELVPRGEQQERIRAAIAQIVAEEERNRENASAGEGGEEKGGC